MKTEVSLETDSRLKKILEPSLESDRKVSYQVDQDGNQLDIKVETDSFGPLRGATDTVFRLAMLGNKILQR